MESDAAPSKSLRSWLLTMALLVGIIGLLVAIAVPNFVHSGSSKRMGIINNLRQIEAAKQQWAIEHSLTNTADINRIVTEKDLAPYLLSRFTTSPDFGNPAFGEVYLIRNLNQPCEAVLTKELIERYTASSLPRGSVIRLSESTNYDYEIVLPDGTPQKF